MSMILVLGSKPDPMIPPASSLAAVACANASGHSAAQLALPSPEFTVMSAILSSGIGSGEQSLEALRGLKTQTLWYYARPQKSLSWWRRLRGRDDARLMTPEVLKSRLTAVNYNFADCREESNQWWRSLVLEMAGGAADVAALIAVKQPSTGMAAIALALSLKRWDEVCVAGFSFELTHAYGANPEINERGTKTSKHADTDIAALIAMGARHPELCTSEVLVHERCGLRLVEAEKRGVGGELL